MDALPLLTQDMLIDADIQLHLKERALELMADAAHHGFVINLNMHTTKQKETFKSLDALVIAPDGRPGKTFIYPEQGPYGIKYSG